MAAAQSTRVEWKLNEHCCQLFSKDDMPMVRIHWAARWRYTKFIFYIPTLLHSCCCSLRLYERQAFIVEQRRRRPSQTTHKMSIKSNQFCCVRVYESIYEHTIKSRWARERKKKRERMWERYVRRKRNRYIDCLNFPFHQSIVNKLVHLKLNLKNCIKINKTFLLTVYVCILRCPQTQLEL